MKIRIIIVAVLVALLSTGIAQAYVASSTNYRILSDSINFGGGNSSSTNYTIEDTLGEIGTGTSTSSSYNIRAGYQAMQVDASISITTTLSTAADSTLSPSLTSGQSGSASGSTAWTVTTNNPSGYTLSLSASTDPALQSSSDSFADYDPSGANPDYDWSIESSESAFGYSPEGSHIVSRFKDNGSSCGAGALDTSDKCWDGFSTSPVTVSQSGSSNSPGGTETTVKFMAEVGSSKTQTAGSYSATITATAVAL